MGIDRWRKFGHLFNCLSTINNAIFKSSEGYKDKDNPSLNSFRSVDVWDLHCLLIQRMQEGEASFHDLVKLWDLITAKRSEIPAFPGHWQVMFPPHLTIVNALHSAFSLTPHNLCESLSGSLCGRLIGSERQVSCYRNTSFCFILWLVLS